MRLLIIADQNNLAIRQGLLVVRQRCHVGFNLVIHKVLYTLRRAGVPKQGICRIDFEYGWPLASVLLDIFP